MVPTTRSGDAATILMPIRPGSDLSPRSLNISMICRSRSDETDAEISTFPALTFLTVGCQPAYEHASGGRERLPRCRTRALNSGCGNDGRRTRPGPGSTGQRARAGASPAAAAPGRAFAGLPRVLRPAGGEFRDDDRA